MWCCCCLSNFDLHHQASASITGYQAAKMIQLLVLTYDHNIDSENVLQRTKVLSLKKRASPCLCTGIRIPTSVRSIAQKRFCAVQENRTKQSSGQIIRIIVLYFATDQLGTPRYHFLITNWVPKATSSFLTCKVFLTYC